MNSTRCGTSPVHLLLSVSSYVRPQNLSVLDRFLDCRVLLGADDFDKMWDVNRILGPLFFFGWTIAGYFILANIFIAIMAEAIEDIVHFGNAPRVGIFDTAKGAAQRLQVHSFARARTCTSDFTCCSRWACQGSWVQHAWPCLYVYLHRIRTKASRIQHA